MKFSLPRWVAGLGLLLLMGLLVLWALLGPNAPNPPHGDGNDPMGVREPQRTVMPVARPSADEPVVEDGADEACPESRDQFRRTTGKMLDECRESLDNLGCEPPLAFSDADVATPVQVFEKVSGRMEECGIDSSKYLVDCTEFPCVLFARGDSMEGVRECVGVPAPDPTELDPSVQTDLVGITMVPTRSVTNLEDAIEARSRIRAVRAASYRPSAHGLLSTALWPGCDDAAGIQEGSGDCDVVARLAGCQEMPDLAVSQLQREDHIERAQQYIEDLAARCGTFEESDWFLDCSRVPCVLGFDAQALDEQGIAVERALCMDDIIGTATILTNPNHEGGVTMLPLHAVADETLADRLKHRWKAQGSRRWEEVGKYLGARLASERAK